MAKITGLVKIEGTLDDMTFYHSTHGLVVKKRARVSKASIMTDKKYERLRENMSEFSAANKAAGLLRFSVSSVMSNFKDRTAASRLNKSMVAVALTDSISDRGMRRVENGDVTLLKDFNFNETGILNQIFTEPFTHTVDRATGILTIDVPGFIPKKLLNPPFGSTHFVMVSVATGVDFVSSETEAARFESAPLPIDNNISNPLTIQHQLAANNTRDLFLLLGIRYTQVVNGKEYPFSNKGFNSLAIVVVDKV